MRYLGVFATAEEVDHLKRVLNTPYIVIGGVEPESPLRATHRIALAHGLPEIPGYYGCDLRTGEFVQTDE